MKRLKLILLVALVCVLCVGMAQTPVAATQQDAWGVKTLSLDTTDGLSLYHSYGNGFYALHGKLWTDRYQESKAIVQDVSVTDVTVSVDLFTPTQGAYLDGGIYVGIKGTVGNGVDSIDAYEVNIERSSGHNVAGALTNYEIKVHRFRYAWLGVVASTSVVGPTNVSLTVKVEGKTLSVYTDGCTKPRLTYEMQDYVGGGVGLRTYQCQMGFDNLRIEAAELETDTSALDAALAQARAIDPDALIAESRAGLADAITAAEQARASADQREIDAACKALTRETLAVVPVATQSQLKALITQAEAVGSGYTQSSLRALDAALTRARALRSDADEKTVSCAAWSLRRALDALIKA